MTDTTATDTPIVEETTSTETPESTDAASERGAAENTADGVQLAAAAAAVEVDSPGRGAEQTVTVEAGQTYHLAGAVARFSQDGANLVVHWGDGGHTTLEDYLTVAQGDAPVALTLADGSTVSFDQLAASIEGFDLATIAPAAVVPAAGPAGGRSAGGAFNTPFDPGDIGDGPGTESLLGDTALQFNLLTFFEELPPVFPAALAAEGGPIDLCDPVQLRALFVSTWTQGAGETIVLDGEGYYATGGSGDDNITGNDLDNELDGGDGNDLIVGGKGDDTLVGDFQVPSSEDLTFSDGLHVSNDGGDNQSFDGFRDLLEGGDGNDVLVGEMFLDSHGSGTESDVFITVSNYGGDGNSFTVFNDFLDGGEGNDVVVGDVYWLGGGSEGTRTVALHVTNESGEDKGADNNVFDAFNDMLIGGDGHDTLVGDVFLDAAPGGLDTDIVFDLNVSNYGGDGNTFHAFNDILVGGKGDDILVGDAMIVGTTATSASMDLEVSNDDGDGNLFNAFNDHLCGGDGHDILVGDAFFDGSSGYAYAVSLAVSNYSGDNNTFSAFNDHLEGNEGDDVLVGDVYFRLEDGDEHDASLTVSNDGGDHNTFFAFNDFLDAGAGYGEGGGQTLVGDVFYDGFLGGFVDISLEVYNDSGNDNAFGAFNDILTSAGNGDDVLVGDILYDNPDGDEFLYLAVSNDSGDTNTFAAFNDSLTGGDGADTLVGDLFYRAGDGTSLAIELEVSNDSGSDNTFEAFNDTLVGGDASMGGYGEGGGQVLVGDVYLTDAADGSMDLIVSNQGGGFYGEGEGDSNVFRVFNDDMSSGDGDDTLVGDAWVDGPRSDAEGGISLTVSNEDGDNNTFTAFSDTLDGGDGDNTLVGDVWFRMENGETSQYHELVVSNNNGDLNTFSAFNDELTAGAGDDLMVGDLYFVRNITGSEPQWDLGTGNFRGDGNTFEAFNDTLDGGDGDNHLVGDVFYQIGSVEGDSDTVQSVDLAVSNRLGDENTFSAFNDLLMAGAGADLLVGDVWLLLDDTPSNVETDLTISNDAGFDNDFSAFNDTLSGGGGDDTLVGDIFSGGDIGSTADEDPGQVNVVISNVEGAGNDFSAFNDNLDGGAGDDIVVGDVFFQPDEASSGSLEISVTNDDGDGGADNNNFSAFNDSLTGGDGDDTLVGDIYYQDGYHQPIDFTVSDTGGDGNTFDAFNDTISGGGGDDTLVGDVLLDNNSSDITVTVDDGGTNNAFTLFSDVLDGGGGDDVLFGDFVSTLAEGAPTGLSISLFGMDAGDTLFSDTIDGGSGDDLIWGQIGDDMLTGGVGADTFFYTEADNSADMGDGNDTITDFSTADDTVDLDALFDALGGTFTDDMSTNAADRADAVTITAGTDAVLTISDPSAGDFSITFTGVDLGGTGTTGEFTVADLAALGIDVGS